MTGWAEAVKFGPLVRGDLLDRGALSAALAEFQPVAVMHFAALSQVGEASREPGRYWRNNVLGSCDQQAGCRHWAGGCAAQWSAA